MSDYGISLEKRLKSFLGPRLTYYEDSDDEEIEDGDSDKEIDNKEKDIQKDPCIKERFSFYSNFHGYNIRKHYGGEKIKSGLRVIRSRSWIPPEDYIHDKEDREIGTIINVAKGGVVKVQWDSSNGMETCGKGDNGQYDLLLLDNAQIGVMHSHVQCDGCKEHPLRGIRWKCRNCANYDLCTRCYMDDEHDFNGHRFKRIQSENAKGEQMMSRTGLEDYTAAIGIGEGATVKLRSDDKHEGIVQELLDKKIDAFRSDAKVKWNDSEGRYAVGTDGKCDLKFKKEGKGPLYYADHLPVVSSDSAFNGLRVVRGPAWKENNKDDGGLGYVGTIVKVHKKPSRNTTMDDKSIQDQGTSSDQKKKSQIVEVQWDNGYKFPYDVQNELLRILDNGPLGVEHESYYCDICNEPGEFNECIKGFKWQCLDCKDYDLCNKCYMEDEHDATHKFQRVIAPNKWEQSSIFTRENSKRVQSYGIFKGAQVVEYDAQNSGESKTNEETGTVTEICNCKMDNGRSEVAVKWSVRNANRHETTSTHDILELQTTGGFWIYVYHEHLPILGKDFRGYFDVDFVFDNSKTTKKIKLTIWRNIQQEKKETFKPSLFIVFADHPEVEKGDGTRPKEAIMEKLVEEVIEFAKKTRLPCLVAGRKVMFYGGSSNSVFIHYKTDKDIIQELVKKGFKLFERGGGGGVEKDEDDIQYFQRMAEYVYGETVLPVIISLRKGAFRKPVMRSAAKSHIPIIRFKKHSFDVTVLTPVKFTNYDSSVEMTEHVTNVRNPWSVQKSKPKCYDIGRYDNEDDPDEIAFISEGPSDFKDNFDAIICCLIIGVSMESKSQKKRIYGKYTDMYPNALSMYLLKEGKWKIPKEHITKSFNQRSIEYIYEKDMEADFKHGLWLELQNDTNMAFRSPRMTDRGEKEERQRFGHSPGTDSDSDDDSDVEDTAVDEINRQTDMPEGRRTTKKLKVSISELYGLIFLALLQKQYWIGAKQLIETGCIRIHHILVGCVILENTANSWQTAPLVQDRLRRLNKAFTQRASRILESIYETDKKTENDKQKRNMRNMRNNPTGKEVESNSKEDMELGEHINHAGSLLLNHGYIEDAIKTQNRTFLDNKEVRNIINKMWYGLEHRDLKTIVGYIVLAACHIILLPLLMVTRETRPTLWLYKQYKLPFMKVCIHLIGFLWLLFAYAYMLLFDYRVNGISHTDYFIITWMVSFFVDETKQHIVSIIRRKWKSYISDWWNRLDWCSILVYTVEMCLKFGEKRIYQDASKVSLVFAFILLCIRILNLFCMSEILGPKLVMIRKMFSDTGAFMAIMAVIMMCYNISFHALLYTNSEFTWSELEKSTKNGYWMLFGELNLDGEKVTVPDCTFNRALFSSGALQQCPSTFGLHLVPYLKAFYGLIAVILLLNLLIAMYSNTFKVVHEEAEFYWSQLQNDFLEEYSVKTIFPIHVQLLVLPVIIIHAFIWVCCLYPGGKLYERSRCDEEIYNGRKDDVDDETTLNRGPMFVRVFLYNTNFDLKLKSTNEAEGNGAMKAKGEIDIMETDRITKLQVQLDSNSSKLEQLNEKNDKRNQKLLHKQKEMDKYLRDMKIYLKDMKRVIMKRLEGMHGSFGRIEKEVSKTAKIMKDADFTSDEEEEEHESDSSISDEEDSDELSSSLDLETSNDPDCKMQ